MHLYNRGAVASNRPHRTILLGTYVAYAREQHHRYYFNISRLDKLG